MAKKRSGDNYPLDVKGKMMFLGSMVCVPYISHNLLAGVEEYKPELRLGYISKVTQKRGFDVTIFHSIEETEVLRIDNPHTQINVIESSELKTIDKLHEAIRFAATMAAD